MAMRPIDFAKKYLTTHGQTPVAGSPAQVLAQFHKATKAAYAQSHPGASGSSLTIGAIPQPYASPAAMLAAAQNVAGSDINSKLSTLEDPAALRQRYADQAQTTGGLYEGLQAILSGIRGDQDKAAGAVTGTYQAGTDAAGGQLARLASAAGADGVPAQPDAYKNLQLLSTLGTNAGDELKGLASAAALAGTGAVNQVGRQGEAELSALLRQRAGIEGARAGETQQYLDQLRGQALDVAKANQGAELGAVQAQATASNNAFQNLLATWQTTGQTPFGPTPEQQRVDNQRNNPSTNPGQAAWTTARQKAFDLLDLATPTRKDVKGQTGWTVTYTIPGDGLTVKDRDVTVPIKDGTYKPGALPPGAPKGAIYKSAKPLSGTRSVTTSAGYWTQFRKALAVLEAANAQYKLGYDRPTLIRTLQGYMKSPPTGKAKT